MTERVLAALQDDDADVRNAAIVAAASQTGPRSFVWLCNVSLWTMRPGSPRSTGAECWDPVTMSAFVSDVVSFARPIFLNAVAPRSRRPR